MTKRKAPKTAFKPGRSGNPNGRPKKGETLTDILRGQCEELISEKEGGKVAIKTALARKMVAMALGGDQSMMKYVFDRIDGFPTQAVQHQDEDGKPIIPQKVVFEVVEAKNEDANSKAVSGDNQAVEI